MKSIPSQVKLYVDYLRIQNFSPRTIKSYRLWLQQFLEFRENQEQARIFILYKLDEGVSWSSINVLYSSLRKYYKEVLNLEWYVKKLPRPRTDQKLPELISKSEVVRLIEHMPLYKHQVATALLYATGLRVSEGMNLRLADIHSDREQIFVRQGKGSKDRYVYLPNSILLLLREYYKRCRPVKYVFEGRHRGKPLSASAFQKAIQSGRKQAGILKKVTSHTLRHCYATHHLETGTNLVFLQRQMGYERMVLA